MAKKKKKTSSKSKQSFASSKIKENRLLVLAIIFLPMIVFGLFVGVLSVRNLNINTSAATCTKYAHPNGNDASPGTKAAPVKSVQKLGDILSPGQVGCLAGGKSFPGSFMHTSPNYMANYLEARILNSGNPGNPITIKSEPGGPRATITGRFVVAGNNVVVENLNLHHAPPQPMLPRFETSHYIYGDNTVLRNNDISNFNKGITCVFLGNIDKKSKNIKLEGNRIHHCGYVRNNHNHGIYAENTDGLIMRNNYIYKNADWGMKFYPNADNSVVENNIFDGNRSGVIFSGDKRRGVGYASDNNIFRKNLVTFSVIVEPLANNDPDVDNWYPVNNPTGKNNRVYNNCVFGGIRPFDVVHIGDWGVGPVYYLYPSPQPATQAEFDSLIGFIEYDNKLQDPQYVNREADNYTLLSSSPCLGWGPDTAQPASTTPPPPPTTSPNPEPQPDPETPPDEPINSNDPNTPSSPVIEIPNAGSDDPIEIPKELITTEGGTITADFTGDGLNDVVEDKNNDGFIDLNTELVVDGKKDPSLTDTSLPSLDPKSDFSDNSGVVTIKAGPLPEATVSKPVAYTFLVAQGAALTGLGVYFAVTKLAIFAGLRGRLGL